jgi:hypothetical protein
LQIVFGKLLRNRKTEGRSKAEGAPPAEDLGISDIWIDL